MTDFLAQGGYAFYVWTAYAISVLVLATAVVLTVVALRKAKRLLRHLETRKGLQHSETNL
jgi:heme exporter protein D